MNVVYFCFYFFEKIIFRLLLLPMNIHFFLFPLRIFFKNACLGLWLFLGCTTLGCVNNTQKIVSDKVDERIEAFTKKKVAECWQQLYLKVEKKVDSLLLAEAQLALQDSLSRLRPSRPTQPPAVPAIDSAVVKPLFNQE